MNMKMFLYARKSTDAEDRQIRSIPDQLIELRELAQKEGFIVLEEFTEAKTAKIPGRPVFNSMLERIEKGQADGILSWHPDRLARNSVDGGKIIYLIDQGIIKALKFPTFWFEPTPQGKFTLNMAFCQSKYYVDSLSENTKRGLRQKVKRGEYPSWAPAGYLNVTKDNRKVIIIDKKRAPIIKKAFEMFAEGTYRIYDIRDFLVRNGILTRNGKPWHVEKVANQLLRHPFYYGHFRYLGEVHEGVHEPIITKKLWDKVQEVLQKRGRPKTKEKVHKPYMGLFRCGYCNMMITAEQLTKHFKGTNRDVTYRYYRCTKKSKTIHCIQPYVKEEEIDQQLSKEMLAVSLRADWANEMLEKLSIEEQNVAQSAQAFVWEKQAEIKEANLKLQRLLDSYLEQDIDRESYLTKKADLLALKKKLEEQIISFQQSQNAWLEPFKNWIMEATNVANIARGKDLDAKKVLALKIFGSNLTLKDKKVCCEALNIWAALRAAPANSDLGRG